MPPMKAAPGVSKAMPTMRLPSTAALRECVRQMCAEELAPLLADQFAQVGVRKRFHSESPPRPRKAVAVEESPSNSPSKSPSKSPAMSPARSPARSPVRSPPLSPARSPPLSPPKSRASALPTETLPGRKRVLPVFVGKTFYPEPASPTSSELADELMDGIDDVITALEEAIAKRSAEWRRENADYYDGETPKTSQESNDNSEFNYSQRSVADIVDFDNVIGFIFEREDGAFLDEAVQPFMGNGPWQHLEPEHFRNAVRKTLKGSPKALVHVLRKVLGKRRDEARRKRIAKSARPVKVMPVKVMPARAERMSVEDEVEYLRTEFPDLH